MARTPFHTADACQAMLGARGALTVTSENRKWVRSWLTANGVASTLARSLALADLGAVYNDHSDTLLNGYKARSADIHDDDSGDDDDAATITPPPFKTTTAPDGTVRPAAPEAITTPEPKKVNGHAAPDTKSAAEKLSAGLSAMLAEIMARPAGIDEPAVRALIAAELSSDRMAEIIAKHSPVHRIKIENTETGETRDVGMQHAMFPTLLKAAAARHDGHRLNIWLTGAAGSGKTTAARKVAEALGLPFAFNGAIDTEYKLLGFTDAQGRVVSRPFRTIYEKGGVYLFDEVDASLPAAVLALNAALANGTCDFPDACVERHADCVIIAAANTWGTGATADYVGRFKQDAAFGDRFVQINWQIDEKLERATAPDVEWCAHVQTIRARAKAKGLKHIISPRATYFGAALLNAGLDRATVEAMTIRKGLTDDQWNSIAR